MRHDLSTQDKDFYDSFISGAVRPGDFHHREHVKLAYIFLVQYGAEEAAPKFRDALQAFLRHHGIDAAKYHETMTQAWLLAVWHFMQKMPVCAGGETFLQANPILANASIMFTHYSRDVISSEQARREFVAPDLDPIPRYGRRAGPSAGLRSS